MKSPLPVPVAAMLCRIVAVNPALGADLSEARLPQDVSMVVFEQTSEVLEK